MEILVKSPINQIIYWHIAKKTNRIKALCHLRMPVNFLNINYPNNKVKICKECQIQLKKQNMGALAVLIANSELEIE